MTPEQKAEVCAALARVLTLEGNAVCADCGQAEGMRPTWASTLCGVLLCMRCAGIHRGLGVHVSKAACTGTWWGLTEELAAFPVAGKD
eukprot:scaffold77779_cov22-Tisochrysis_lutea.AAC.5